jgi:hypothetical protein
MNIENINYEYYIVRISVQKKELDLKHPLNLYSNYKASGTGVYIDKGIILTCYHVVENALEIIVYTKYKNENKEIKTTVKYIFPDDDLAVIELTDKDVDYKLFTYQIVSTKNINLDVLTVGFPMNSTTIKVNRGVISGFQDSNIQTDSTLNPGNSGGPLLLNNKLIGINQSRMSGEATNTGFAIPIFRFLILYYLKKDRLKLINNKPDLLFDYQKNYQHFYNLKNGVRITRINKHSILNNYDIHVDDLILKIENNKVNNLGKIKFSFFPEEISIEDLYLWFTCGDELTFTIYSFKNKSIRDIKIKLSYVETNLIKYYDISNRSYNFEKNGLVFSIFTNYHLDMIKELKISLSLKVKLLNRFINNNDKFTVYLSDLIFTKLKFTNYPIDEIITHINEIEILDYDTLIDIMKKDIHSFRTLDNEIYYI